MTVEEFMKRYKGKFIEVEDIMEMYEGKFTEIEFYKDKFGKRYGFHTDRIEYVDEFEGNEEVIEYDLMDEELYNNTILANCNERFTNFFDSGDKVLVIKVK